MKVQLVTAMSTIVRDLRVKRLWPVAVLLLVALIAVPVVITSSGGTSTSVPPAPVVPVTPAIDGGSGRALTIADAAVIGRARPGAVHDPFFNPPKPDTSSASGGDNGITTAVPQPTTPAATPTSTTTPAGPQATTTPGTTTTPVVPQTGTGDATKTVTLHRVHVRWGADKEAGVRGLSRLQPLGDSSNPALLYLGTNSAGTHAAFLLGPNAIATGQGECAEASCRVISLKAGQSVDVGVVGLDGAPSTRFTLVLHDIADEHMSPKTAIERRTRVAADGRDVLRTMIKDPKTAAAIGHFTYDGELGAVVLITAPVAPQPGSTVAPVTAP